MSFVAHSEMLKHFGCNEQPLFPVRRRLSVGKATEFDAASVVVCVHELDRELTSFLCVLVLDA